MEKIINALTRAVAWTSANLDESSFDNDKEYWWATGHADGLSSALHLAQELDKGTDIETALRMAIDMEEE